ncbi:hypothetical protein K2X85_16865 [bacterium]|nr:hypothetical protein [bacterium]
MLYGKCAESEDLASRRSVHTLAGVTNVTEILKTMSNLGISVDAGDKLPWPGFVNRVQIRQSGSVAQVQSSRKRGGVRCKAVAGPLGVIGWCRTHNPRGKG